MTQTITAAFDQELRRFDEAAQRVHDAAAAWRALERAHILSQALAWPHVRVHWLMLRFAWRQSDTRELVGQLPRLLLAAPGSWFGRAPLGNTGRSTVGIFTSMPLPPDLALLLGHDPQEPRHS